MMDQSVNFTPLSHKKLRELWILSRDMAQSFTVRRLILSAIWREAMEEKESFYAAFRTRDDAGNCRCATCWANQDWFLAKLREVGIDWREDG